MNNEQTLASLGNLAENVRLRGISACPYCHQGFGSASLSIHVGRCRARLPPSYEEAQAEEEQKRVNQKKKPVIHSLVDLCLRLVAKHFKSICMDRISAFPEAEAALISSLPSNLVHRMVVNLVKDNKRVEIQNQENRATIKKLKSALQEANQSLNQLESARRLAANSRTKIAEQNNGFHRLQLELKSAKDKESIAERNNQRLQTEVTSAKKKLLCYDAKVNKLKSDKVELEKALIESQRREMETTKQLALARKANIGVNSSRHRCGRSKYRQSTAQLSTSTCRSSEKNINTSTLDLCKSSSHAQQITKTNISFPSSICPPAQQHQNQDEELLD
ncbi:hypothetical protein Plhal304r1_c018g0065691 [Plasmopara halstedii]